MGLIPQGHDLYVVDLTYSAPFETIETVLEPHMAFVRAAYAEGRFLMSGPKVPREGGVVIMTAPSEDEARAYLAADPFVIAGVVDLRLTRFKASNLADALS